MGELAELIPEAKSLFRVDKLRLIRLLAEVLAGTEADLKSGQSYAVWSPDSAFNAADALLKALANEARS